MKVLSKLTRLFPRDLEGELKKLHEDARLSYTSENNAPARISELNQQSRTVYVCHSQHYNSPSVLDLLFNFIQENVLSSPRNWVFGIPHAYGTPEIDFLKSVADMTRRPVSPSIFPPYGEEVERSVKSDSKIPQNVFYGFLLQILTNEGLPRASALQLMSENLRILPEQIEKADQDNAVSVFTKSLLYSPHHAATLIRSVQDPIMDAYNRIGSEYWGKMLDQHLDKCLLLYMLDSYFSIFRRRFKRK